MRLSIILLVAVLLSGCGGAGRKHPRDFGPRTSLGIQTVNVSPTEFARIDAAWVEVQACWNTVQDGNKVSIEYLPRHRMKNGAWTFLFAGGEHWGFIAGGGRIYLPAYPNDYVIRHEFSHYVGRMVTGSAVPEGSNKCWIN